MDVRHALVAATLGGLGLALGPAQAPALIVSSASRSVQPGELVVLTVSSSDPVVSIDTMRATAFGRDLPVDRAERPDQPAGVGESLWRFLVGIDLDVVPGSYPVAIRARAGSLSLEVRHTLTVTPKKFATRTLTVDESFVNPPEAVRPRIAEEAARLERCWRESSPTRLWSAPFVRPVDQASNSAFGTRSIFNGQPRSAHGGADFLSPAGTPVRAANDGRVMLAGNLYYSGGTVVIDHGLGVVSLYAHLSAMDVRDGDAVSSGQVVGRVGATGRVTGAHLHWTVRVSGARVDPLSLLAILGETKGR